MPARTSTPLGPITPNPRKGDPDHFPAGENVIKTVVLPIINPISVCSGVRCKLLGLAFPAASIVKVLAPYGPLFSRRYFGNVHLGSIHAFLPCGPKGTLPPAATLARRRSSFPGKRRGGLVPRPAPLDTGLQYFASAQRPFASPWLSSRATANRTARCDISRTPISCSRTAITLVTGPYAHPNWHTPERRHHE